MIGPMLMAGLTHGLRSIAANASDLARHVSDVVPEGLVSLRLQGSTGVYLQQQGGQVVVAWVQPGNDAAMASTFRMLDVTRRFEKVLPPLRESE